MTISPMKLMEGIWNAFTPVDRKNQTTETNDKTQLVALERVKRSPGHENLAALDEEPDWYHD